MTRREPSSVEASNAVNAEEAERLLAAGRLLSESGVFGFVWLDDDLRVTSTYGDLVSFVAVGAPVTQALIALVGMEDTIAETKTGSLPFVDLPAVAIRASDAPEVRLNLTFYWMAPIGSYLLLVSRALPRSNLERELSQQMRARLMAESDARALAKQLSAANRDLEEFASIISHDLRSPLRALRYHLEAAESQIEAGTVDGLDERLKLAKAQARRVSTMLGSLFEYSSTGHKPALVMPTNTRELVTAILASLPQLDRFHVEILGDWPLIDTVSTPLDLVLRNLVENAVKHHDQPIGRLILSAREDGRFVVFTVTDDGPGIPEALHQTAFLPFRQLRKPEDEPPPDGGENGTGMGLALVKRTVEAVGGRIELISNPDSKRGTTFRILWPIFVQQPPHPSASAHRT